MMKLSAMKVLLTALCVSFFPIQAMADGFTGLHTIQWLNMRECKADRGLEVKLTADHANPDNCSDPRILELRCPVAEKTKKKNIQPFRLQVVRFEAMVELFRTALVEDFDVLAFVDGCDGNGHSIVSSVRVEEPLP